MSMKTEKDKRSEVVHIRLTQADKKFLEKKAVSSETPLATLGAEIISKWTASQKKRDMRKAERQRFMTTARG
jgi:hypothetical protein